MMMARRRQSDHFELPAHVLAPGDSSNGAVDILIMWREEPDSVASSKRLISTVSTWTGVPFRSSIVNLALRSFLSGSLSLRDCGHNSRVNPTGTGFDRCKSDVRTCDATISMWRGC